MKIVKSTKEYIIKQSYNQLEINKDTLNKLFEKTDCIFKSNASIEKDNVGYFIRNRMDQDEYWCYFFNAVDRNDFMNKILGYNDQCRGTFPYCNSENDVIKLLNAIIGKILNDL